MPPKLRPSGKQLMSSNLINMTVDHLKQQLKAHNLSSSSNKKALTDCLKAYLDTNPSSILNRHTRQHEPVNGSQVQSSRQCKEGSITSILQRTRSQHQKATTHQHKHHQHRGSQRRPNTNRSSSSNSGSNSSHSRSHSHNFACQATTARCLVTFKYHSA